MVVVGDEQRLKGGVGVGGLELELELGRRNGGEKTEEVTRWARCGSYEISSCTMSPKAQNRDLYLVPQTASI